MEGPGAALISLLPTPQPPTCLPVASVWPQQRAGPLEGVRLGDVARFLGEQGSPAVLGQLELWGPRTVPGGLAKSRMQ